MWQQAGSTGGQLLGNKLLPGIGGHIGGFLGGALGKGLGGLFGGRKRRGGGGQDAESMMRGLYGELSDPGYGMERMQRMAASSQPSLSDYFGMAAQRGGSMAQAQEQFNAGSQRGQAGAYGAMLDMEGQRMGQRAGLLGGLMDWDKAKMQDRMSLRSSAFSLLDNAMGVGGQALVSRGTNRHNQQMMGQWQEAQDNKARMGRYQNTPQGTPYLDNMRLG
jgi:hypothetical protein